MKFRESLSSTIIGAPQIEYVSTLYMKYISSDVIHAPVKINKIVSDSSISNDTTLPNEVYVRNVIQNKIKNIQQQDISDVDKFLQIYSGPLDSNNYHHDFFQYIDDKTFVIKGSTTPLFFKYNTQNITMNQDITVTLPDSYFGSQNTTTIQITSNSPSSRFAHCIKTTTNVNGDFCVSLPQPNADLNEYSYISNNTFLTNSFDSPRGQFKAFKKFISKNYPNRLQRNLKCTYLKLLYVWLSRTNNNWNVNLSYKKPVIVSDINSVTAPVIDTWYLEQTTKKWFFMSSSGLNEITSCFLGCLALGTSGIVASWSMPPMLLLYPYNTVRLNLINDNTISTVATQSYVNIFNKKIEIESSLLTIDKTNLCNCCQYYIYVDIQGKLHIDWKKPYLNLLNEWYHYQNYWKCVGEFYLDVEKNIINLQDFNTVGSYDDSLQQSNFIYDIVQDNLNTPVYTDYQKNEKNFREFNMPLNISFIQHYSTVDIQLQAAGGNGYSTSTPVSSGGITLTMDTCETDLPLFTSQNILLQAMNGQNGNVNSAGTNTYSKFGILNKKSNLATNQNGATGHLNSYGHGGNRAPGNSSGFGGNSGSYTKQSYLCASLLPSVTVTYDPASNLTPDMSLGCARFSFNIQHEEL